MKPYVESTPEIQWKHLLFFTSTALLALLGAPIYVYHYGLSISEVLLFLFMVVATGLSITVGYHRLYAHATFKAHPIIHFLTLFFGAAAFEQSALLWSAQHRSHHQYVDTDKDPYSIKKGFFYAHIGWILFWKQNMPNNVKDLQKNFLLRHQHQYYDVWSLGAGIVFPLLIGILTGHLLGAFLISICARFTLIHHSTFSINSVCHMFGKATYDIYASAKDHWLVAFLTNGEGYHNFHHRFPSDYRNGVRWYQWDPSKWVIFIFSTLGLAKNLRRVSRFRILAARLEAQNQMINDAISTHLQDHSNLQHIRNALTIQYQHLKSTLEHWDHAVKEYQALLIEKGSQQSEDFHKEILKRIRQARAQFRKIYMEWTNLISLHPLDLQKNILTYSVS